MIFTSGRKGRASTELEAAFQAEALVHMNTLYGAAMYMTKNPSDAEDLVQETLLKAYRFWHRYEPGTNCRAWLFRILTNTFINRTRRKKPMVSLLEDADTSAAESSLYASVAFYSTPEVDYLSHLFPEHVKRAVEALPENFRIPVILADLHDFSYKEVAEIMECPVGTVMSRLFRGRKRLQEQLFEYAVELGVISPRDARDDVGAISLQAYRERKRAASGGESV